MIATTSDMLCRCGVGLYWYADEPGSFTIVPDRIDVLAPGRLRQQIPHKKIQTEHDHHAVGDCSVPDSKRISRPGQQVVCDLKI
jgi:hypothetical protein